VAKPEFVKSEKFSISDHPELNELWIQGLIAEDPSILGLGDLVLKDKERIQPKAGRLDLLLQDAETKRRYEVEVQLGKTDESHIIRTIEYWDIERKRYPQYDHCAVIIAEDITSRFLNVINLFNGNIPLIAIQMNALKMNDIMTLSFTTVLDELVFGLDEEDGELEVTNRAYWEDKGTIKTVSMVDQLFETIKTFDSGYDLKYNKFYIGLTLNGRPNNFALFKPKKKFLIFELRLNPSEELKKEVEDCGLDDMGYIKKWNIYRIRLVETDLKKNEEIITKLLKAAYEAKGSS
jgi:predicted transport protein